MDLATGNHVDLEDVFSRRKDASAGYVCFYLPEGVITDIQGLNELKKLSFVRMVALSNLTVGQKTEKMTFKGQRLGPIIVTGKDRAELELHIEIIKNTLQISVTSPSGEKRGIIWS